MSAAPAESRYTARLAGSIRPYDPADRAALRAFQKAHFGEGSRQCDDRYFHWLFESSPHQRPGEPALWICKRDGVVVGQQARLPVTLKIGDAEVRAAWGVDLMVHPDWRLRGVGPALFAHYEQSSEVLLGLGLSGAAHRTCLRAGWSDMGMLPLFARPLDADACAQALGSRAALAKCVPEWAVRGTARVAAAAAKRFTGCSLDPVHSFDERIDYVWGRAARDYPVLAKRDFRSLRWRFDEAPDRDRYHRYYFMRRGELVGYAVTRLDTWRGQKVARLIDHLCERRWRTALLALVIDAMRTRRVAAVFLEQFSPTNGRGMLPLGCFPVGAATRFMVKTQGAAAAGAGLLHEASRWYVSRADSDSDLPSAFGS